MAALAVDAGNVCEGSALERNAAPAGTASVTSISPLVWFAPTFLTTTWYSTICDNPVSTGIASVPPSSPNSVPPCAASGSVGNTPSISEAVFATSAQRLSC